MAATRSKTDSLLEAIRTLDREALSRRLAAAPPSSITARHVVEAARRTWTDGLSLLAEHGGDVNAVWRGYRPLHALIQEEPHADAAMPTDARLECLHWLLAHGADPERPGAFPPARAILVAAFGGEVRMAEILREAGARITGFTSAAFGDVGAVADWIRRTPSAPTDRDHDVLTALQCAAASRLGRYDAAVTTGLHQTARVLLEAGADPNAETRAWSDTVPVSYFAVRGGHLDMLALLLERGANPSAALPSAVWQRRWDMATLAVEHGATVSAVVDAGRPLLNDLVRWGQFEAARWLLSRGADPNQPDERGWTAVHQATSRGNVAMLRDLLAAGGDRARRDRAGNTPLAIAADTRNMKIEALLAGYR
jgi:ankyrin repeat protein